MSSIITYSSSSSTSQSSSTSTSTEAINQQASQTVENLESTQQDQQQQQQPLNSTEPTKSKNLIRLNDSILFKLRHPSKRNYEARSKSLERIKYTKKLSLASMTSSKPNETSAEKLSISNPCIDNLSLQLSSSKPQHASVSANNSFNSDHSIQKTSSKRIYLKRAEYSQFKNNRLLNNSSLTSSAKKEFIQHSRSKSESDIFDKLEQQEKASRVSRIIEEADLIAASNTKQAENENRSVLVNDESEPINSNTLGTFFNYYFLFYFESEINNRINMLVYK
jgi:hypothetical protein